MAKTLSLTELRKMTPLDLEKEIMEGRAAVAALKLALKLGKQKDTHLLQRGKLQLARMLTVSRELQER